MPQTLDLVRSLGAARLFETSSCRHDLQIGHVISDAQPCIVRQAGLIETNSPALNAKSLEGCRQRGGRPDIRLCDEKFSTRTAHKISRQSIGSPKAHDVIDIDWLGNQRGEV